jgi:hypothetical protein
MYEPDFESDDNHKPIYPCVFTSYICNLSTPSDDSRELPCDLFLLDSGANIHIVSSLAMLKSMIRLSGTRSDRILTLDGSDTLTVKGINPKKGLRPTHRYYVESYGHVLVVPGILQNIVSTNFLRKLGVTTLSCGQDNNTKLRVGILSL